MPSSPGTVDQVLADRLRRHAAQPLVTFYDDATGERVELSVATYANWVAKTAGLAQDELDVSRGDLVLIDLPTHWLGAVWLGAAWSCGLVVTDQVALADQARLVVCGPEALPELADHASRVPVVGLSLRPLGGPFTEPLPTGVLDYGAVVLAQPDVFVPLDRPEPADPAWRDGAGAASQAGLLGEAAAATLVGPGDRLLTDVNPCSRAGLVTLLAPLLHGAATVWVRRPDESGWEARAGQEQAAATLRA